MFVKFVTQHVQQFFHAQYSLHYALVTLPAEASHRTEF